MEIRTIGMVLNWGEDVPGVTRTSGAQLVALAGGGVVCGHVGVALTCGGAYQGVVYEHVTCGSSQLYGRSITKVTIKLLRVSEANEVPISSHIWVGLSTLNRL